MRLIGTLANETEATRFGDFLYTKGIENQVDPDSHGRWEVWVLDDVHIEAARSLLDEFRRSPDDPIFAQASNAAARRRRQDEAAQAPKRARVVDARTTLYSPPAPLGPVTIALVIICIAVAFFTSLGKSNESVQPLSITEYQSDGDYTRSNVTLPEIRHGQFWRLFTPIFLHFGILHIFFNMLWLRDLGSMIEAHKSRWLLPALVVVIAGTSNLAQYRLSGPAFGGMSGVNYGLLGYIWMQSRFKPASGLSLQPQVVASAILWFFLCLFNVIQGIANTVHAVGLGVGIAGGLIDAYVRVVFPRYKGP